MNPGNAWKLRQNVWDEFLHDGKFAYTYTERFNEQTMKAGAQLATAIHQLQINPGTRQAIVGIHQGPREIPHMGGAGRVPCSMYYQFLRRHDELHMIYTMRSCDLLTHFPVDIILALKMQEHVARELGCKLGTFTYFCGSLHAYRKDMKAREIF
jgi:thymidylate synthase